MKPDVTLRVLRSIAFSRLQHAMWFVLVDFLTALAASFLAIVMAKALGFIR